MCPDLHFSSWAPFQTELRCALKSADIKGSFLEREVNTKMWCFLQLDFRCYWSVQGHTRSLKPEHSSTQLVPWAPALSPGVCRAECTPSMDTLPGLLGEKTFQSPLGERPKSACYAPEPIPGQEECTDVPCSAILHLYLLQTLHGHNPASHGLPCTWQLAWRLGWPWVCWQDFPGTLSSPGLLPGPPHCLPSLQLSLSWILQPIFLLSSSPAFIPPPSL